MPLALFLNFTRWPSSADSYFSQLCWELSSFYNSDQDLFAPTVSIIIGAIITVPRTTTGDIVAIRTFITRQFLNFEWILADIQGLFQLDFSFKILLAG